VDILFTENLSENCHYELKNKKIHNFYNDTN